MIAQEMATLMDGLVADAHASRDRAFNNLHAVDRESRRATERLAVQVTRFIGVHERSMAKLLRLEVPRLQADRAGDAAEHEDVSAPAQARDSRFDPEDEWAPEPTLSQAPSARPERPGRRFDREDEDEPETWLR